MLSIVVLLLSFRRFAQGTLSLVPDWPLPRAFDPCRYGREHMGGRRSWPCDLQMDPPGKILLQLGQKGVPGVSGRIFNLPTDVAFAAYGDGYVSDGYANGRVVNYSR